MNIPATADVIQPARQTGHIPAVWKPVVPGIKSSAIRAPTETGTSRRNETRTDVLILIPEKIPPAKVTPNLEIPGRTEMPWMSPIRSIFHTGISRGISFFGVSMEETRSTIPVKKSPIPVYITDIDILSAALSRRNPTTAVGTQAASIRTASFL